MKIDKKSWHYHVANTYTNFNPYYTQDICSYTRTILLGILNIALIILIGSIVSYSMIIDPIFQIFLFNDYNSPFFIVGTTLWGFLLFICFMSGLHSYTEYRKDKPSGFVKKAYNSWKNKFCIKLEFD